MTALITIPGVQEKGKSCCPCSEDRDPCACATVKAEVRERCGKVTICGYHEFILSKPPRRYRRAVIKGEDGSDESLFHADGSSTLSADCSSCVGYLHITQTLNGVSVPDILDSHECPGTNYAYTLGGSVWSTQRTINKLTSLAGKTLTIELKDENKPAEAIKASKTPWGPWGIGGGCAFIKQGDADGEFLFCESEVRFTAKGSPNAVAKVELTYTQTDLASGGVEVAHETLELWCDGAGDANQTKTVPCRVGKRTCLTHRQIS